jgi:hypothetical protein
MEELLKTVPLMGRQEVNTYFKALMLVFWKLVTITTDDALTLISEDSGFLRHFQSALCHPSASSTYKAIAFQHMVCAVQKNCKLNTLAHWASSIIC